MVRLSIVAHCFLSCCLCLAISTVKFTLFFFRYIIQMDVATTQKVDICCVRMVKVACEETISCISFNILYMRAAFSSFSRPSSFSSSFVVFLETMYNIQGFSVLPSAFIYFCFCMYKFLSVSSNSSPRSSEQKEWTKQTKKNWEQKKEEKNHSRKREFLRIICYSDFSNQLFLFIDGENRK